MTSDHFIYKITPRADWDAALVAGRFDGAPVDVKDGFIHFSTADQVAKTAEIHFSGQNDLLLVAVDSQKLGDALKWEVSRGGALFPHLYAHLLPSAVVWSRPMLLSANGTHQIPLDAR